jgi:hypothetical protein
MGQTSFKTRKTGTTKQKQGLLGSPPDKQKYLYHVTNNTILVPTTVKGQALMHENTNEPVAVIRTVIFSLQFTHLHISITLFRATNKPYINIHTSGY